MEILASRLEALQQDQTHQKLNGSRKDQVGSGQRGDKIKTYRVRDNQVVDHRTGKKTPLDRWLSGYWE